MSVTAQASASTPAFRGAYGLTEDQEPFKRTVHEFVQHEIVPTPHEYDEREAFPWPNVRTMAELGLLGLVVPKDYGGAGTTTLDYVLAMEEVSWACASYSVIMSVNNSLVCDPILRFGTEAQKREHLPRLAGGQYIGGYCLSEPSSGWLSAELSSRGTLRIVTLPAIPIDEFMAGLQPLER